MDTIVAPATPLAGSSVTIIRLSGPRALDMASRLFIPWPLPPRYLTLGEIQNHAGELIDQAMAVAMPGPNSFTGEDVVEFHCHGGVAVGTAVIDACLAAGSRLAEPGEFSKRAFLNGQIDLAQAEAIADLVAAQTNLGRKAALSQLRGGLSACVNAILDDLTSVAAKLEASIDFSEEDIEESATDALVQSLDSASGRIADLLASYARGRVAREGVRVVLAGPPNVGKSSIFNALVGRERAIVTPHPGTTRDTIECTVEIAGVAVTLVDTAGIREAVDPVELVGIQRTHDEIESADLVLHIREAATVLAEASADSDPHRIVVANKVDALSPSEQTTLADLLNKTPGRTVAVSAAERTGLGELEDLLRSALGCATDWSERSITSARHAECLRSAAASLERARAALADGMSPEFPMSDLREALDQLGAITGRSVSESILDEIFHRFCIGK